MNKMLSILVVCLLLAMVPTGVGAVTQDLEIVLNRQSPYPVEPDQVVDIEVSLQNTGYADAENLVFEVNPQSPFELVPGQDAITKFTRVSAQDSVTASYKLYVDKNAISNNYELEFLFYKSGETVKKSQKITVQVQGNPKLILDEIITSPVEMEPGAIVTLTAKISNVGTGSASFMEANLVSNTSYILPVLSGGSHYIGEIKPGETGESVFTMSVDNSAEYKTYSGMMVLSYKDDSGTPQTSSFYLGMPIRGKPVIEVLSAKRDNGAYKVDIENIGTADAKALKVTLVQFGDIKDSAISNEIKPSKHKTFRFNGFSYGEAVINISYLDESNEFFSQENIVTIKDSSASDENQGGGTSPLLPILIVVVVLESYYVWRLRKRMKK